MERTFDLRLEPRAGADGRPGVITLADLAGSVRRPHELARLLWGTGSDRVDVLLDDAPLSGPQAGALLLAGLARARQITIERPSRRFAPGRAGLLLGAALLTLVAVPRELVRARRLRRDAAEALGRTSSLPRRVPEPSSVLYLRTEPALRWHGHLVGGAATHTRGVINGFVANGLRVEVVAAERPDDIDADEVTEVPIAGVHHLSPWLTLADYGTEVARAAAGRRPSFVYQRYSVGTWAGVELAERAGVPLVLEFNGSELWIAREWGGEDAGPGDEVLAALEEHSLRSASLVVVVSDVLRQQLVEQDIDPSRVLVNPNGVDVERVTPYRERPPEDWRSELGLPEVPTIGFVGSFGYWHGVTQLPAMVEAVAERVPEARWVIIGDGQLHADVRRELAERGVTDRVELTGIVPHDRALALLAACDVCVSPHVPNPDGSRFFGSPTKLFEYMGLGRAIVASDLEQIGEVLDDGDTALLHPAGDAQAAAAAVVRLLGDPALRARLGAAAFERARTDYSWAAHARRILDAIAG